VRDVQAVILAGGFGTRISEETAVRPKPMVEIGEMPILWHVMKIYAAHGITDFVIAAGYKSAAIKEFFAGYVLRGSTVTFDLAEHTTRIHHQVSEPWRVTVVETGVDTMTGGRVKRCAPFLDGGAFCLTYGDCVADIDVGALVAFHRDQGALATMTAVQPPGRFGAIVLGGDERLVRSFHEKPSGDGAWVNGGFFVVEPEALDYIAGDDAIWERGPLERLAADGRLAAYRHLGFWHPMDTLRDRMVLEEHWRSPSPPWRTW
jgi:glucose-1-phosphate cytidylyltransferase